MRVATINAEFESSLSIINVSDNNVEYYTS